MSASLPFPAANARVTLPRTHGRAESGLGALLSLAAHAGVLAALSLAVLAPLHERAAAPAPISLVFAAPAAAPPAPAPEALPANPPVQQAPPKLVAKPVAAPAPPRPVVPRHVRVAATEPRPVARPAAAAALPEAAGLPLSGPPPEIRDQAAEDVAGLKLQIQRAVQAAAVYPQRARLLHRQGRAQVRFDYAGGEVAGVALAQSSQSPMLDEAALDAVRRATYPKAAAQLRLALVVWVNFAQAAD